MPARPNANPTILSNAAVHTEMPRVGADTDPKPRSLFSPRSDRAPTRSTVSRPSRAFELTNSLEINAFQPLETWSAVQANCLRSVRQLRPSESRVSRYHDRRIKRDDRTQAPRRDVRSPPPTKTPASCLQPGNRSRHRNTMPPPESAVIPAPIASARSSALVENAMDLTRSQTRFPARRSSITTNVADGRCATSHQQALIATPDSSFRNVRRRWGCAVCHCHQAVATCRSMLVPSTSMAAIKRRRWIWGYIKASRFISTIGPRSRPRKTPTL